MNTTINNAYMHAAYMQVELVTHLIRTRLPIRSSMCTYRSV